MGRRRDAAADPQQHPSLGRPRSEAANPVETIIPTNSITCTVERCTGTWWPITTSATRVVISGPYRVGALTPAGKSPTAVCTQPGQDFSSGPGTRSPPGAAAAPGHGPDGDVPHHGAATSGVPRHTPRSLDRDDLVRVIDLAQRRTRLTDLLTWLATRPGPRRPTPRADDPARPRTVASTTSPSPCPASTPTLAPARSTYRPAPAHRSARPWPRAARAVPHATTPPAPACQDPITASLPAAATWTTRACPAPPELLRVRVSRTRKGLDVGRASGLGAVRAMEVGPPEPPCGGRFQTTHCCVS